MGVGGVPTIPTQGAADVAVVEWPEVEVEPAAGVAHKVTARAVTTTLADAAHRFRRAAI
jgi:hypothetical protein